MHRLFHAKECLAQRAAIDAIVPRLGRVRQLRRPLSAREVHRALVIEVQARELVRRVGCHEVNLEHVWARPTTQGAGAAKDAPAESLNVGRLVAPVSVAHKLRPVDLAEAFTHAPGKA